MKQLPPSRASTGRPDPTPWDRTSVRPSDPERPPERGHLGFQKPNTLTVVSSILATRARPRASCVRTCVGRRRGRSSEGSGWKRAAEEAEAGGEEPKAKQIESRVAGEKQFFLFFRFTKCLFAFGLVLRVS